MANHPIDTQKQYQSVHYTPALMYRTLPFYLNGWGHMLNGPAYFTERQGRHDFLIVHTLDGTGFIRYRQTEKYLNKGDIFFIDCNEYQCYGTASNGYWEIQWIHFAGCGCKSYFDLINGNSLNIIHCEDASEITSCMQEICHLLNITDFQADMKIALLITRILTALIIHRQKLTFTTRQQRWDIIKTVTDYISINYTKPLNISDMASTVHISPYHLSRLFKEYTSLSPHQYLIKYRIDQSKKLLKETDLNINDIATTIGFENVNNFIRNFKKLTGTTPLKFRRFWID